NNKRLGELYDVIVKPAKVYPQSSAIIIRKGFINRKYAVVNWENIVDIYNKDIILNIVGSNLFFEEIHDSREELTLRRDILDQQVVDTHDHKVIRVNDIHLLFVDKYLMAAHVDISLRGLIRRLNLEKSIDVIVKLLNKNARYLKDEHLIAWKYIQPLSINSASMTIKVDVPEKQFINIPSADLGEIFLDLNIKQQIALFKSLDLTTRAKIFANIDYKTQKSLVEDLQNKEIAEVLSNMPSDDVTDFLEKISKEKLDNILGVMESQYSKKLSQLLGYSSDSAGGLMTTEYLAFAKDTTIESVLKQIKEYKYKTEPPQFVYIVDEGNRLIGCTNFRRLILANPQDLIQSAAFPKIYSVQLNSGVKEIAYLMEKYKYYTIPVVDENNILHGVVTVDDILSQIISIAWRRFKKIKAKITTP
ncbi:magnesium transporter, partial [bacterium]